MITSEVRPVNYRGLMKKVEQVVAAMERADDIGATINTLLLIIIDKFHDELGITGGRLYQRRGDVYFLQSTFGDAKEPPRNFRVPLTYPPIQLVLEEGAVYMAADDPRMDRNFESLIGVRQFAAIEVGDGEYILAFDVTSEGRGDDIRFSLGILRHSINQKIRRDRMEGIFAEARKIQASILPRRAPAYGNFDIAGRSEPMEAVGGDFYDYIPVTSKILGLTIADVSGHGLPAALQVRDIYMGLRMGLARDFKIVRTVERMNNIIHQSTLTSRFVSMFYGELELNGVFIYVNAGHPAPFHLAADGTSRFMEEGGPVLGPLPGATYERGFVIMKPGDILVFFTDGICETHAHGSENAEEEYGVDRLLEVARNHQGKPAQEIVDAIFADVEAFGGDAPVEDDRTVFVVAYPPDTADLTATKAFPRPPLP